VRVIIGSANLTEPAYRKNQEVFGSLDFSDEGEVPGEILLQVLSFLEEIMTLAVGTGEVPSPKSRLRSLLNHMRDQAQRWTQRPRKKSDWPRAVPVLLGPFDGFRQPIPERLGLLVRERGGPAYAGNVVSPFFDRTEHEVYPANEAVLGALTDRGHRELDLCISKETLPGDKIRLRAPMSVTRHGRKTADIRIYPVGDERDGEVRPLHAKSLWYWNDNWHVYMIGSSNFTSAGLGLADSAMNVEANLAYVFPEHSRMVRLMEGTLPAWEEYVKDFANVLWEPVTEEEGEDPTANPVLPVGFQEALFEPTDSGGLLKLSFGSTLPAIWRISPEKETSILYSSQAWGPDQATVELTWKFPSVPRALRVHWKNEAGLSLSALWPVNVSDTSRLLPPDALRNLSLETLVEILGSKLPLHEAVAAATKTNGPGAYDADGLTAELDPLKRYHSETFLLQRTRRVAKAIEQLIANLNRPVFHKDSLLWRLHGPVGPLALARALNDAATSPGESSFLLAELLMALRRIDVGRISVGIEKSEVLGEFDQVKAEIRRMVQGSLGSGDVPQSMSDYVSRVLTEAVA
jgi:hypothetical protein